MELLDIIHYPDKRLRMVAEPVTDFEDEEMQDQVHSMMLTCGVYKAQGLAAPQVGINKRIFVAPTDEKNAEVFINPRITEREGTQRMSEGCLSFPGAHEVIERSAELTLVYQTLEGEERTVALDGLESVAVQHELDHLDGILFIDKVSALKRGLMLKRMKKVVKRQTPKKKVVKPSRVAAARKERKRQRKHRRRAA